MTSSASVHPGPSVRCEKDKSGALLLRLSGPWLLREKPGLDPSLETEMKSGGIRRILFDTSNLEAWDTALMTFLFRIGERAKVSSIEIDYSGLPQGTQRLLRLASAVPPKDTGRTAKKENWVAKLGEEALRVGWIKSGEFLDFLGQAVLSFGRFFSGKAKFQIQDFILLLQEDGAKAIPIVTLVNLLVGLILAFVGAVQLKQFGASIYVANLVGIAVSREMGPIMMAIILSGRTGAAYAARLGTMKVTQEIDALSTFGIRPFDFLVLPRLIALCVVAPLLCLYADLWGILGGMLVGTGMLHLSWTQYFHQTVNSVALHHFIIGIVKSVLFGALIALSGCMYGMRCGNSASAVGDAATSAVVTSIVLIIATDGIITTLLYFVKF